MINYVIAYFHKLVPKMYAHFYYPYFPEKTMLISKSYFPKEITRLGGIRNTASTVCFILEAEKVALYSHSLM